jgi:hypothetical protein
MKLNRTQALFLVGTIAAIGCVVENSDDGGDGDNGSAGDAGEGGTSGGTTGGSAGSAGNYTGGTNSGGTSMGGGGGQGGETCLDDATSPVACADFAEPGAGGMGAGGESYGGAGGAGPACESLGQDFFCADLWTNFKPGVANAARTCMNAQTSEDLCTWDFTFGCASEAILAACPDDSANDECEAIMAGCPDLTLADCSSVLGAMTQAGRDMVVTCAAESLECNPWICAGVALPAGG